MVGESGCGKSTLLFAIAQLLVPPAEITGGSVTFQGRSLVGLTDRQLAAVRWKDLSVVMQSAMNALNPVKSIGAQFKDAMRAHGVTSKAEIAGRSAEVLRMVGIDPVHLKSYPFQLSGGMRQRSMIAMAMLFTPDLVIMDEPTSALDVVAQRSLMVQIKELQQRLGFAIIFVTHDMSLVSHFSDRLMVMYAGQVAEFGPTREVFDAPRHPYSIGLLDAFPSIRGPAGPADRHPGRPAGPGPAPGGLPVRAALPPGHGRVPDHAARALPGRPVQVRCLLHSPDQNLRNGTPPPGSATGDVTSVAAAAAQRRTWPRRRAAPMSDAPAQEDPGPASTGPLLRTEGLSKHFKIGGALSRRTLHAVDDVSLDIGDREIVALAGESGSGKSTIARLLAKLYKPTSGEIYFQGQPVSRLRSRADTLRYTGLVPMVFQDPFSSINPVLRISHGVLRGLKLHRPELSAEQRRAEAERVFEVVGLAPAAEVLQRYPHELSGGQRQRVGFAQALALRPKLILADEPVSMLDVSIRIGLLNLMARLRDEEGVSILYITHDIASARYIADRLIVMYAGQIAESGPVEEVLGAPKHPYTQLLLSAVPDPRAPLDVTAETDRGEPPRVIDPVPGCRFRWRCPLAIDQCHQATPELAELGPQHAAACFVAQAGADVKAF